MAFNFSFGKPQQEKPKQVDPLIQRLNKIKDSYDGENTSYRFQTVVYNQKASTATSSMGMYGGAKKPGCVTDDEWAQYVAGSPDPEKMEPNVLRGFTELDKRIDQQSEVIELMRKKLKDMTNHISEMRAKYIEVIRDRLTRLVEQNNEINMTLMEFLQKEEVNALQSHPFSSEEHEIFDKLEELRHEINRPNKFISALNTLNLNAKMMRENFTVKPTITVNDKTMKASAEILKTNSDALKSLVKVIKETYKATDLISAQLNP